MKKLFTLLALLVASSASAYQIKSDGNLGKIWVAGADGKFLFNNPVVGLTKAGVYVPLTLNDDGTIGISASFSGAVDQGNAGTEPWLVTSSPSVSTTSTITNVTTVAGSSVILIGANAIRKGFKIFDQSATNCFVAMSATASPTSFSVILMPFGVSNSDITVYQGAISAYCSNDGNILITEY